jgi:hypothetical protein
MAELMSLGDNHRDWLADELDDDQNVTKERNKKRRKTALIIDIKNPLVQNIILPLPQLVSFVSSYEQLPVSQMSLRECGTHNRGGNHRLHGWNQLSL